MSSSRLHPVPDADSSLGCGEGHHYRRNAQTLCQKRKHRLWAFEDTFA